MAKCTAHSSSGDTGREWWLSVDWEEKWQGGTVGHSDRGISCPGERVAWWLMLPCRARHELGGKKALTGGPGQGTEVRLTDGTGWIS
jgi:hypothetical protein